MVKKVYKMKDGGKVTYITNFLTKDEAQVLYNELKDNVPWTHGVYKIFGKPIKTPRLLYALRDEDTDITKSYKVTDSMPWTPKAKEIREKIEKATGYKITYAQLNYYRDGKDSVGYHTDQEVMKGDIIASISLGATRKFVLRHKNYKTDKTVKKYTFQLENGSLLIMNDSAAKFHWKHTIPKVKTAGPRINITFRPR